MLKICFGFSIKTNILLDIRRVLLRCILYQLQCYYYEKKGDNTQHLYQTTSVLE